MTYEGGTRGEEADFGVERRAAQSYHTNVLRVWIFISWGFWGILFTPCNPDLTTEIPFLLLFFFFLSSSPSSISNLHHTPSLSSPPPPYLR